jgi:GNAT superfamily N-acetyltransferase
MPSLSIRSATPADVDTILHFIRSLAAFEREPDAVKTTPADLLRDGFGERPKFETLIAELDGAPVGFALFFHTYSTWEGTAGIHLEDIFVEEAARRHGVGKRLMQRLAAIALERGCARLELQVLDWNPARDFYQHLGLEHMQEWLLYRVNGQALRALARDQDPQ